MRILANENFPAGVVRCLRAAGHDVAWIWEDARGCSDDKVLARAQLERRVVATFDKDFGELAFRTGLPAFCGVLLFRLVATSPARLAEKVLAAISTQLSWEGYFAAITETRIRLRNLPTKKL